MSGLQCPACDEVIEFEDAEGHKSLSQLLGAGVSQSVSDLTEARLREHLETHTVEDWVTALVMADRYIAVLEQERDEAVAWKTDVEAKVAKQRTTYQPRPGDVATFDFGGPPPVIPVPPGMDFGAGYVQPEARPRRQHVDPEQTLIPRIPMGQRPEGVVGRKT